MEQLALIFGRMDEQGEQQGTYRRYLILDYLDRLQGRTALVQYEDGMISFSVPVQLSSLGDSSVSDEGTKLTRIYSEDSAIHFNHKISAITVDGNHISAVYGKTDWGSDLKKKKRSERIHVDGFPGIAKIVLTEMDNHSVKRGERLKGQLNEKNLLGKTVQLVLSTGDDWIGKVISLTFVVQAYSLKGGSLLLRGTHGVELQYKGVVGVRHSEESLSSIIDIRETNGHMTKSFHLWHTNPRYL